MNNNLTNNTIPHRENNDLFVEVQTLQLKETTSSYHILPILLPKAQNREIIIKSLRSEFCLWSSIFLREGKVGKIYGKICMERTFRGWAPN